MRESNYAEDMQIDDSILDIEWLEQPALMFKYSKQASEAKKEYDEAKDKLDYVKAQLDSQIRKDPSSFGVEKITETVVTNTIILQQEYADQQELVLNAKFNFDIVRGATDAVNARKDALENMVKLYGMQYFAGPKVPHDLTNMRKRKAEVNEKRASKQVAKKMSRTQ